jgi:hypothetical protein
MYTVLYTKTNLDFYVLFVTYFDFLSLKTDVNVPSKVRNKKTLRKQNFFLLGSCQSLTKKGSRSVSQWFGSADPDPYQNVTDIQHCSSGCPSQSQREV